MKILMTGATRFLGRHLLPVLGQNHDVVATIRDMSAARPGGDGIGITWIGADL